MVGDAANAGAADSPKVAIPLKLTSPIVMAATRPLIVDSRCNGVFLFLALRQARRMTEVSGGRVTPRKLDSKASVTGSDEVDPSGVTPAHTRPARPCVYGLPMEVQLLGPLVVRVEGTVVPLRSARERATLSLLAFRTG